MSENKRVSLTTLSCGSSTKKPNKSVRVRVALPESNEDTYPEFNYKDELAALKKKPKQDGKEIIGNECLPNGTAADPFGDDNDDDVRRIALEMEAKYGSGVSGGSKKKRRGRKDDYADIGAGYDESDSFIDNTDGYDEMIPPNVTTVRGGFYINSGALEFKTDDEATSELSSESSEDEKEESASEHETKSPGKRKRILDSSEDEGDAADAGAKEKESGEKQPNISLQQAIKKKMFSSDKIQVKKRKLSDFYHEKTVVKDLLKEKRSQTNNSDGRDIPKENKKPMRLSSVLDAIDTVIGRAEDNIKQKFPEKLDTVIEDVPGSKMDVKIVVEEPMEVPAPTDNSKPNDCVKLPENLPEDILEIIENVKRVAREQEGGLVKFFTDPVNELFLNLERKCKILGRSSKVKVYEHLASFLKCRKETLMKRSKTLVYEGEKAKLNKTIDSLKGQINQLMPALITNHEKECQRILQKKFSQEAAVNEELKHLKAPRRKFPLHEEMKRMLREIVVFKKRCFLHEGKRKEDLEELLLGYMKSDILILWPDGWMSMAVLKKYCAPAGLKTPDVTSLAKKPTMSYNAGSSLTITPINLSEKLEEVNGGGGAINDRSPPTTITHTIWKNDCPPLERRDSTKDNGVIVLSSVKKDNDNSLSSSSHHHCQIIDLTEVGPSTSDVRLSNNAAQDDVQKVIESLKALHKLSSSPSKSEPSSQSGVSVIAYNKNYGTNSNENSFQDGFNGSSSASASSKPRL